MNQTTESPLLRALGEASQRDLADVQKRIAELQAEIAILKDVEKILCRKFRSQTPSDAKLEDSTTDALKQVEKNGWSHKQLPDGAKELAAFLQNKNGLVSIADASRILGRSEASIRAVVGHNSQVFEGWKSGNG